MEMTLVLGSTGESGLAPFFPGPIPRRDKLPKDRPVASSEAERIRGLRPGLTVKELLSAIS